MAGVKEAVASLEHVVVRGDDYERKLAAAPAIDPDPHIELDHYHVIRHSGGTTGIPKGMGFTHRAWMKMERDWTYRLPTRETGDACIHVAPI